MGKLETLARAICLITSLLVCSAEIFKSKLDSAPPPPLSNDAANQSDICFGDLGCFSMSPPWFDLLRLMPGPESPDNIDTQFYLYSRHHTHRRYVVKRPRFSLSRSYYDPRKSTVFLTHGFANDGNATWMNDMKNAILNRYDVNLFIIDWGKGASKTNYLQVASNARVVGAELTRLCEYLISLDGANASLFHFIGHSLGAHVVAYAAKQIPNCGRITALDPAQPGFEGYDKIVRLDADDAKFVMVVHTTALPFIPFFGLGAVTAMGHVDFYMNGGWQQPGCAWPLFADTNVSVNVNITNLSTVSVEVLAEVLACPHGRAYEYFTAAVMNKNCTFWGYKRTLLENVMKLGLTVLTRIFETLSSITRKKSCQPDTCIPLGFETVDFPARGLFTIVTTNSPPFCNVDMEADMAMASYKL